jgi:hypothetical protein
VPVVTPPLPAMLRTVRLTLDLEADLYEVLEWGAKRMGHVDLADYALDLLTSGRGTTPGQRPG